MHRPTLSGHPFRWGALVLLALLCAPGMAADSGSDAAPSANAAASATGRATALLADARQAIAGENWDEAIRLLKSIASDGGGTADVYNLLGFSLRKSGDMANALDFYLKALALDPGHKGAHEYLGELYVETGEIQKAEAQLEIIGKLCGTTTCEEYKDLEKAIAAAR